MNEPKVYRLFITPKTQIDVSDNERWMFNEKITWEYLLKCGKKKRMRQILEGKKKLVGENCFVARKKYILTYLDYKRDLRKLFYEQLSEYPTNNVWLKFYVPMPKSWSKKKRKELCFMPHEQTADASNLHKAFEDACCDQDKANWDYRVTKFWVDMPNGFIEVHVNAMPPAVGYTKVEREDIIR